MAVRQQDFLFAEHVLRRGFANEEQIEECLGLLTRLKQEMDIQDSLEALLVKKGFLAPAQAQAVRDEIQARKEGKSRNAIEGYRLIARLGAGAMGSVYKAHHVKLDIPVAIKVLRQDHASSRTQIERLKREAQLAARLNHPNIVRSLDVGESNGFHYFTMEYVEGTTVRELLRKGPLPEKEALRILEQVTRALEHAHAQGVVHRDVKPGNIMITPGGTLKLADFGLARGQKPSDLTIADAAIGTPQYLAPEQARSAADATGRSDLFSLGASLYHMVTARPPFSGDNLGEIFHKVLLCQFDPPETVVPNLSLEVLYLIHKLMRANPRERYQSAGALLQDLETLRAGQSIVPAGFRGDYKAFLAKRRAKRLGYVGAGAAVVLVATFFIVGSVRRAREREENALYCSKAREIGSQLSGQFSSWGPGFEGSLAQAKVFLEQELEARAELCSAEFGAALGDLRTRLGWVTQDLEALTIAAEVEDARKNLATAYERVPNRANFNGTEWRVLKVRRKLRKSSDRGARRLWQAAFEEADYTDVAEARHALTDLKRALRDEFLYLETANSTNVGHQIEWLQIMVKRWAEAERDYGEPFGRNLAATQPLFGTAGKNLSDLEKTRRLHRAWAQNQGLDASLLRLFPARDEARLVALETGERSDWRRVQQVARDHVDQGRWDLAYNVLNAFSSRADALEDQANATKELTLRRRDEVVENQEALFAGIERRFFDFAGRRDYTAARRLVDEALEDHVWILSPADRIQELRRDAVLYQDLHDRFLGRVTRLQTIAAAGRQLRADSVQVTEDPDRFRARLRRGKEEVTFALADLTRADLQNALAFDPNESNDERLRAYFELAEGYGEKLDPRKALRLFETARENMRKLGEPRSKIVAQLAGSMQKEVERREAKAEEMFNLMMKTKTRSEYSLALQCCSRLRDPQSLRHTKFVDDRIEAIDREWRELKRYASGEMLAESFGLPKQNVVEDAESGRATIAMDFTSWYPDQGKAPENVDPEVWEKREARKFWAMRHAASDQGLDFKEYLARATHQTLGFNEHLEHFEGGLRLKGDVRENNSFRWWAAGDPKFYEKIRIGRLRNPLDPDHDWSIEFSVRWDEKEPVYFAVAAGSIQAGVVCHRGKDGAGHGTRIFIDPEIMHPELDKRVFKDFHRRLLAEKSPKIPLKGASVRTFAQNRAYRIRLERRGRTISFYARPLESWGQKVELTEDDPWVSLTMRKDQIDKAGRVPAADFRFLSLIRFTLDDLELSGTTLQREAN